ncbi:hypothetical protein HGP29_27055 [Flammeovirga sp. SR4]|uniref:Uncharacterized protein n=2 Tax=Flammeovirga agarivorans TaxID=2726742 RepID=A0A7X8XZ74_9BACT|nr:hypothetical protein [Flammeovirga agarivorans]
MENNKKYIAKIGLIQVKTRLVEYLNNASITDALADFGALAPDERTKSEFTKTVKPLLKDLKAKAVSAIFILWSIEKAKDAPLKTVAGKKQVFNEWLTEAVFPYFGNCFEKKETISKQSRFISAKNESLEYTLESVYALEMEARPQESRSKTLDEQAKELYSDDFLKSNDIEQIKSDILSRQVRSIRNVAVTDIVFKDKLLKSAHNGVPVEELSEAQLEEVMMHNFMHHIQEHENFKSVMFCDSSHSHSKNACLVYAYRNALRMVTLRELTEKEVANLTKENMHIKYAVSVSDVHCEHDVVSRADQVGINDAPEYDDFNINQVGVRYGGENAARIIGLDQFTKEVSGKENPLSFELISALKSSHLQMRKNEIRFSGDLEVVTE